MSIMTKKKLKMSSSSSTKNGGIRSGDEMQQAWLPDEIMDLIIGKLMAFPKDLARFSAVCKRWHRHLCTVWPELVHQIPPMALIPVVGSKEEEEFGIYNLTGGGYVCSLPYDTNRIIGCSFGWLIITDIYEKSVSLFNPFSKSHIRLPPFSFQNIPRCLMKGVLSKPPEDTHFDVAITMDPDCNTVTTAKRIAFLHIDKIDGELESLHWVYEKNPKYGILDVNSIGGRICIIYSNGNISCRNCNSTYYYGVRKEWDSVMVSTGGHFATVHLLESSSSEPLVVFRYIAYGAYTSCRKVVGFKILSLMSSIDNEMNKTWNWTEIKTLDNDVLFISDLTSICVQAASKKHEHARSMYFPYDDIHQETNFCVYNIDQNYLNLFPNRLVADTEFLPRKPGQPFWLHLSSYDLKFSSINVRLS